MKILIILKLEESFNIKVLFEFWKLIFKLELKNIVSLETLKLFLMVKLVLKLVLDWLILNKFIELDLFKINLKFD